MMIMLQKYNFICVMKEYLDTFFGLALVLQVRFHISYICLLWHPLCV